MISPTLMMIDWWMMLQLRFHNMWACGGQYISCCSAQALWPWVPDCGLRIAESFYISRITSKYCMIYLSITTYYLNAHVYVASTLIRILTSKVHVIWIFLYSYYMSKIAIYRIHINNLKYLTIFRILWDLDLLHCINPTCSLSIIRGR